MTTDDVVYDFSSYQLLNFFKFFLELVLSDTASSCQAGLTAFNDTCKNLYGEYSSFCSKGVCQCASDKSFYMNNNGKSSCGMFEMFPF